MPDTQNLSITQIIKELKDSEKLKPLIMAGIVAPAVVRDFDIAMYVDAQTRGGLGKAEAVAKAAESFGLCVMTVYRGVKRFS